MGRVCRYDHSVSFRRQFAILKGYPVSAPSGGLSIEQLDLLLNELEQLAHSSAPRLKFYSALLERLRFVCSAAGTAFIIPMDGRNWGLVATSGYSDFNDFLSNWNEGFASWASGDLRQECVAPPLHSLQNGPFLFAYASPQQPKRGAVVIRLVSPPDPAARDDLVRLCQAFAELICIRQTSDFEELLNKKLPAFHRLMSDLCASHSVGQAATLLVNDLIPVFGADRIGLIQRGLLGSDLVVAVSGAVNLVRKSEAVEAIKGIGSQVLESSKSVSSFAGEKRTGQEAPSAPGTVGQNVPVSDQRAFLAPNFIAFPIGVARDGTTAACHSALIVEWDDYEAVLNSAIIMNTVIPTLNVVWAEHEQWLQTPALARKFANSNLKRTLSGRGRGWQKAVAVFGILGLLGFGLTRPIDFRIEMNGVLEPKSQRTIYAAQDGVVTEVLVGDSETVKKGQLLVAMRSPELEIQIQEAQGELKANTEKRDALSLNINQLARDSSTSASTLNRLSSEVKQLETVKETLQQKLTALRQEENRLRIESPIDGVIVARDLQQLLDSRPLRRGDALFRVVNPEGPWRLQLSIADSDVGYVKQQLFGSSQTGGGNVPQSANRGVEFVLASKPDLRFQGDILWLSDSARNPRGIGVALDALADVHADALEHVYIGATAHAFVLCGKRPIWFVFSRPLVESIQRKLWF